MNLQKFIIFSVLFLDIIGIAIIIPAFPELKAYYHITDFQVTLGLTVYSLCAFLAAPLLGQLSDKFGRKKPLALCIAGTMLSYIILLITKQYRVFLFSRVINGLTGGNTSIIQAILTDISPNKEVKSKNFGLMGMFFGLGFIIGPIVGSLLLKTGNVTTIFRFGSLFALLELFLIIFHFSNTNHPIPNKELSYNSFNIMRKYFRKPEFRNFLVSIFFLGVGGFMINVTQSLYMHTLFGTSGEQYGYYLAIAGLLGAINMGFMVPKFRTKNFSTKMLITGAHIALIIGYSLVGMSHTINQFLLFFYGTIFLSGFYMPVYNIVIMSHAKPDIVGELSGMMGGLQSMLMFIGPLIGGLLLGLKFNVYYGAVLMFLLSLSIMARYIIGTEKL